MTEEELKRIANQLAGKVARQIIWVMLKLALSFFLGLVVALFAIRGLIVILNILR